MQCSSTLLNRTGVAPETWVTTTSPAVSSVPGCPPASLSVKSLADPQHSTAPHSTPSLVLEAEPAIQQRHKLPAPARPQPGLRDCTSASPGGRRFAHASAVLVAHQASRPGAACSAPPTPRLLRRARPRCLQGSQVPRRSLFCTSLYRPCSNSRLGSLCHVTAKPMQPFATSNEPP